METIFKNLADMISINLTEDQIKKFMTYKEELKEWNEKINLTAIVEDEDIILKHFIDSLTINKYISKNANLIDVGTGAGFPGVPIKIIRDDVKVTLLDSLNKRLLFLNDIIEKNKLNNIYCVHGRAEDVANNDKFREKFDVVTARAVANLATLSELCLPFIKVDGIFICMKGNSIEELSDAEKAIEVLGGKVESVDTFKLPNSDIERNIIVIRKVKNTPKQYPRKAGTPAKNPIK